MPETPIGGFVSGLQAGTKFNQEQQLFQLSMAEGILKVDEQEMKLKELARVTQGQKKAFDMTRSDLSKIDPETIKDPQDRAAYFSLDMGNHLLENNMPIEGLKMVEAAQGIEENKLKLANAQYTAASTRNREVASMMSNLPDDPRQAGEAFDERVMAKMANGMQMDPGALAKAREAAVNPDKRKHWIEAARTQEQQAALRLKEAQAKNAELMEGVHSANLKLLGVRTQIAEEIRDQGGKVGGNRYTSADLNAITDLAAERFSGDRQQLRGLSQDAAGYARMLITKEHQSPEQAYKNAFEQYTSGSTNSFAGLREMHHTPGATAAAPMDWAGPDEAIPNKFYKATTKDGKEVVGWWDPKTKKLQPVPPRKSDVKTADERILQGGFKQYSPGVYENPEGGLMNSDGEAVGIATDGKAYLLDDDGNLLFDQPVE